MLHQITGSLFMEWQAYYQIKAERQKAAQK